MSDRSLAQAGLHPLPWRPVAITVARMLTGCFWLCNAYFTYIDNLISHPTPILAGQAQSFWTGLWSSIAVVHPFWFTFVLALIEGLIGLCLLVGLVTRHASTLGIILSAFAWSTQALWLVPLGAQGRLTGDSGILVVCIFALVGLLLMNAGQMWGVDRYLAGRSG